MPDRDLAKLVMGDSPACFDAIVDLGLQPATLLERRAAAASRERQSLLNTAIAFIKQQHGSGSPWACYLGPAGRFDALDAACDGRARRRRLRPM